jgi:GNAT superfamily N-acetyltransferase
VGVVGLDLPGGDEWPPELEQVYQSMGARIGHTAVQRMERYSELADSSRPDTPHIKVGMIGVSPEHQGKGYGMVLMHATHSFARETPDVKGIWLDTENPRNLPWYQHLGYEVRAKNTMDEISIWGMYKQFDRDRASEA